jgi:glycosyltransferase involved in cell wall biosynthesis
VNQLQESNHIPKVSMGMSACNGESKPLITTIIPTYRRPKLLRRAIKSVLNQTYPHFQVCVYDNASWDETADVVAEIAKKDARVKYHCHAENIGAIRNFNYGMVHVNTPFFSFLSDDDILFQNLMKLY